MIFQIMIFALGVFAAGLAALLTLPLFWRRALRLTRRRVEMQMPLSVAELAVDRDRLRAEFALETCRLEQTNERLLQESGDSMARAGRAEAEAAALRARAHAAEAAAAEAAVGIRETEAQAVALEKHLHDIESALALRGDEIDALRTREHALIAESDERRAVNASLEARLGALELRFADALRDLSAARESHAAALAQLRAEQEALGAEQRRSMGLERTLQDEKMRSALLERRGDDFARSLTEIRARSALAGAPDTAPNPADSHGDVGAPQPQALSPASERIADLKAALEDARLDQFEPRKPSQRRRSASRGERTIKGLEVVAAQTSPERRDAQPQLKEPSR